MHDLVRFWVVVLSLLTGISALGYLSLLFVFPDVPAFAVGSAMRLVVVLVAVVSMGVVVWSSTTHGDIVSEQPRN
jgi:protein-S-isoprenylcysteine O-methyltransferase Ste14